jgi:hypothetical protein
MDDQIPFPQLQSWMHQRVLIPRETAQQRRIRYQKLPKIELFLEWIVSRLARLLLKLFGIQNRWALWKVMMKLTQWRFRLLNRLEIYGLNNIPASGGIFYMNHIGSKDVGKFGIDSSCKSLCYGLGCKFSRIE